MRSVLAVALFCCSAFAQTAPPAKGQQRDLKVEKLDEPAGAPKAPRIPRSYAVIVGVSKSRTSTF